MLAASLAPTQVSCSSHSSQPPMLSITAMAYENSAVVWTAFSQSNLSPTKGSLQSSPFLAQETQKFLTTTKSSLILFAFGLNRKGDQPEDWRAPSQETAGTSPRTGTFVRYPLLLLFNLPSVTADLHGVGGRGAYLGLCLGRSIACRRSWTLSSIALLSCASTSQSSGGLSLVSPG